MVTFQSLLHHKRCTTVDIIHPMHSGVKFEDGGLIFYSSHNRIGKLGLFYLHIYIYIYIYILGRAIDNFTNIDPRNGDAMPLCCSLTRLISLILYMSVVMRLHGNANRARHVNTQTTATSILNSMSWFTTSTLCFH